MFLENDHSTTNYHSWICPDLRIYWRLGRIPNSGEVVLRAIASLEQFTFSETEGYALQHFSGQYTLNQIQVAVQRKFPDTNSNFTLELLEKLIKLGVLTLDDQKPPSSKYQLKSTVEWIANPDGYWILRNQEDFTFMQVSDREKNVISRLQQGSIQAIAEEFCIDRDQLKLLLQMLAATGMLVGTQPAKPPRNKFNPLQLLFFKVKLFNPDNFLSQNIDKLRWLWSKSFTLIFVTFLAISTVFAIHYRPEITFEIVKLIQTYGTSSFFFAFVLLMALVITLHEFGHAFTLKHFGGIVPEMGLLFMMLVPAAYTNTTDSYSLSRHKRILVIGAGIIVQIALAAIAFWCWFYSSKGSWLHIGSLVLMTAALFTVALNLNPLAKFDGYYLAVAVTGINNLRRRAFGFYSNLLQGKPLKETNQNKLILAIYAPFSLAYIWMVFGFLFWRITDWTLVNIPYTALVILAIWLIYYFFPRR